MSSAVELRGKIIVGEPKTKKSRRSINLPQFTLGFGEGSTISSLEKKALA